MAKPQLDTAADITRHLDTYRDPVTRQLLEDTRDMYLYATTRGIAIPEWLGNALAKLGAKATLANERLAAGAQSPDELKSLKDAVRSDLRDLTRINNELARHVRPAMPVSIRATHIRSGDRLESGIMGVPIVRHHLAVAALSVLTYVFFAAQFELDTSVIYAKYVLLLSAAGCGAVFYNLFTLQHYITRHTYDPAYTASYWSRLALGLLSGLILGGFLEPVIASLLGASPRETDATMNHVLNVTPTVLALLGGYSAEAVDRILRRLVETVASFVHGSTEQWLEVRIGQERLKIIEEESSWRAQCTDAFLQLRVAMAEENEDEVKKQLDAVHALLFDERGGAP